MGEAGALLSSLPPPHPTPSTPAPQLPPLLPPLLHTTTTVAAACVFDVEKPLPSLPQRCLAVRRRAMAALFGGALSSSPSCGGGGGEQQCERMFLYKGRYLSLYVCALFLPLSTNHPPQTTKTNIPIINTINHKIKQPPPPTCTCWRPWPWRFAPASDSTCGEATATGCWRVRVSKMACFCMGLSMAAYLSFRHACRYPPTEI